MSGDCEPHVHHAPQTLPAVRPVLPFATVPVEQPQSALGVAAEMELMMGDGDDGAVPAAAPTEGSGLAAAVSEGERARVAPLTPPHPGQKGTEEPESKRQRTN